MSLARDGFATLPLLTAAECARIASYLARRDQPEPEWPKGRAVHERLFYDLATHPLLLSSVRSFLGDDVVLWGASAVKREPGTRQPWHTDIESSDPAGGFVTAWIGVLHTARESAMRLITRSHLVGQSVQEARFARGLSRDGATAEELLRIVRESQPEAELVEPELADGEVLLFDGRLWHESLNARASGTRAALLLQYAAAGRAVRIPDLSSLEWPFRLLDEPRPPVIVVSGSDTSGANRIVPPPAGRSLHPTTVHTFDRLVEDRQSCLSPSGQAGLPVLHFQSSIAFTGAMRCHASVLAPGKSPHPPHIHDEEELLIPLRGEVELLLPPSAERVAPGSFAYYPSGQYHTIRNPGTEPAAYLMFKWNAARLSPAAPLGTTIRRFGDATATRNLLEGPTHTLGKLHAHVSVVPPGGGYEPHADPYDIAIVTLSGTIETLGRLVPPLSVVYCAAGDPHGLRNPGPDEARYLVFEFHSPGAALMPRRIPLTRRVMRLARRVMRAGWRRVRGMAKRDIS